MVIIRSFSIEIICPILKAFSRRLECGPGCGIQGRGGGCGCLHPVTYVELKKLRIEFTHLISLGGFPLTVT